MTSAIQQRVCITGATGFLGRSLIQELGQKGGHRIAALNRGSSDEEWLRAVEEADVAVHLAGATRPDDPAEYEKANVGLTRKLASLIRLLPKPPTVLHASSISFNKPTLYGLTKKKAEDELLRLSQDTGAIVTILRIPSLFGKWSRPNYNSAVATFCNNVATGKPIVLKTPHDRITLVRVQDVVEAFVNLIEQPPSVTGFYEVGPTFEASVSELASTIQSFRDEDVFEDHGDSVETLKAGLRTTYREHLQALSPDFAGARS